MRDKRAIITQKIMMTLVKHGVEQDVINDAQAQLEVELAKCEVYKFPTRKPTHPWVVG